MLTIVQIGYTKYKVETLADATTLMDIMERAQKVTYNHTGEVYKPDADQDRDIEIIMTNKLLIEDQEA